MEGDVMAGERMAADLIERVGAEVRKADVLWHEFGSVRAQVLKWAAQKAISKWYGERWRELDDCAKEIAKQARRPAVE